MVEKAESDQNERLDELVDALSDLADEMGVNLAGMLLVERVEDGYTSKIALRMDPEKMRKILFAEAMEDNHWEDSYHR